MPTSQTYDDYQEDVVSLDMAQEAVADMLDFLVKEEPLSEDDLRALQKDRQKKDNHNMSKLIIYHILNFIDLESQSIASGAGSRKYLLTLLIFVDFS